MKVLNGDKFLAILLSVYLGILPSCSNNPANPSDTAPTLPPPASMQMSQEDLNFWTQNNPAVNAAGLNWTAAAVVVTVFNAAVFLGLALPVAFTAAALNQTPTLEDDGKFHWRFSHSQGGQSFQLNLTAEVMPSMIRWQMFVTSTVPSLDNFLWYEGQSDIDGESGTWTFYDPARPTQQANVAQIDWQVQADDDRSLTFTNQNQNGNGFGDELAYAVQGDSVSVQFTRGSDAQQTRIAWHRHTREGYIIAPNYRNGAKSCWEGVMLQDIDCVMTN